MVAEVSVEKKSTGSTALLFSDSFLNTSYVPRNIAEATANSAHIFSNYKWAKVGMQLEEQGFIMNLKGRINVDLLNDSSLKLFAI